VLRCIGAIFLFADVAITRNYYCITLVAPTIVILFSKKIGNFSPKIIFKQQNVVKESREYFKILLNILIFNMKSSK
jgi:hypothetical protein